MAVADVKDPQRGRARTHRTMICVECGHQWMSTRYSSVDVRCPACRILHQRRQETIEHVAALIRSERGARIAQVALAAAHHAASHQSGQAGPALIAAAVHHLARAGQDDERARQTRLVRLAGAALLWAAEITEALGQ